MRQCPSANNANTRGVIQSPNYPHIINKYVKMTTNKYHGKFQSVNVTLLNEQNISSAKCPTKGRAVGTKPFVSRSWGVGSPTLRNEILPLKIREIAS